MSSETSYENGQLIVTRVFAAPREAVFDAWIENSKVELWWGCGYATKVRSEIEPAAGGQYSHLMTLKDVGEYRHHGLITEYEPPALLAYQLAATELDGEMAVRVEFIEQGAGTLVRLTQVGLNDAYSQFVVDGWSAGFEKLATLLAKEPIFSRPNTTSPLSF